MSSGSSIFRQIGFGAIVLLVAAVLIGVVLNWQANHRSGFEISDPACRRRTDLAGGAGAQTDAAGAKLQPPFCVASLGDLQAFGKDSTAFYDSDLGKSFDQTLENWQPPSAAQLAAMTRNSRVGIRKSSSPFKVPRGAISYSSLLNYNVAA